nr:MAG TPA: hypothetical protein [Caudoviricetes sp.]
MVARQLTAATHFPGRFAYKANGHGRAMLAPTRVFRQFAPSPKGDGLEKGGNDHTILFGTGIWEK